MLSTVFPPSVARSSLEEMLDSIKKRDERPKDIPPALPVRPTSKARLPSRRSLPINFKIGDGNVPEYLPVDYAKEKVPAEVEHKNADSDAKAMSSYQLPEVEVVQLRIRDGSANKRVSRTNTLNQTTVELPDIRRRLGKKEEDFDEKQAKAADSDSSVLSSSPTGKDSEWADKIGYILNKASDQEHVQVQHSVLAELQRHLIKAEAAVRQKEDENTILMQQLQQYATTLAEYESKMKSMQETWQRKTSSSQTSDQEHGQVQPAAVAELQRCLIKAEAAMRQKEDENTILQQQLQQYDMRCVEYESKMKSMEEMWQKKMESLQTSLDVAHKILATSKETASPAGRLETSPAIHYDSKDTMSAGTATSNGSAPVKPPSHPSDSRLAKEPDTAQNVVGRVVEEFEHHKQVFDNDAGLLIEVKSGRSNSVMNPDEELRKLKFQFAAWKKGYKVRLRETKVALQKIGNGESRHARKKWWGMVSTRGA